MALFRFHRGSLQESLMTTRKVKNMLELLLVIKEDYEGWGFKRLSIKKIEPYPSATNNFDARCGWFTHIVMVSYNNKKAVPAGFLSENLDL